MKEGAAAREHAMKCRLLLGKRMPKRQPLTELYLNGIFTEDRVAWDKEPQRHCAKVCVDPEETTEKQEKNESRSTQKMMVTDTLQKKGELLKLQLIWCYKQGPRWQKAKSTCQKIPS